MFDNTNPYTLRTEIIESITHYFVSFKDGQAIQRETEVSRPVYLEFLRFIKVERNLRRSDQRHYENSELTDETLYERAVHTPKSVEDTAFDSMLNEHLRQAIQQLPQIQRRRFVLYYEFGLTYEQIGQMEGCSKMAVKYTIDKAKTEISQFLKNFSD